jgi:hypothetical protein
MVDNALIDSLGGRNLLKLMLNVDKIDVVNDKSVVMFVPGVGTVHIEGYESQYTGKVYYSGYILDAPHIPVASSADPRTIINLLTRKTLTF